MKKQKKLSTKIAGLAVLLIAMAALAASGDTVGANAPSDCGSATGAGPDPVAVTGIVPEPAAALPIGIGAK